MHEEFYKIVAQIIPILFLATSIQSISVWQKKNDRKALKAEVNIGVASFLVIGLTLAAAEFVALRVVYGGIEYQSDLLVVSLALIGGMLYVIVDYLLTILGRGRDIYLAAFFIIFLLLLLGIFISLKLIT